MSNFTFIKAEWPELHDAATKAEGLVYPDARAACFYTRRTLELAVVWLYQHDRTLTLPYQDHLSALIHEPSFRQAVGPAIFTKVKLLKDLGNQAVHSTKPVRQYDALTAVRELFHFVSPQKCGAESPCPDGLSRRRNVGIIARGMPPSLSWSQRRYA